MILFGKIVVVIISDCVGSFDEVLITLFLSKILITHEDS